MAFICRLCGVEGDKKSDFINLFDESKLASHNLEFIKTQLHIWVGSEDIITKFICKQCSIVNNHFSCHLTKCQATQNVLHKKASEASASGSRGSRSLLENVSSLRDTIKREEESQSDGEVIEIDDDDENTEEGPKLELLNIEEPVVNDVVGPNHQEMQIEIEKENVPLPKKPSFQCKICKLDTTDRSALSNHFRDEHKDKSFLCDQCNFATLFRYKLKQHQSHKDKSIKCNVCNAQLENGNKLKAHFKDMHTDGKPIDCTLCDKIFQKKYEFLQHELLIHKDKVNGRWVCNVCTEHFGERLLLELHMSTHVKKVKCLKDGCQFSARNEQYLAQHFKEVHEKKFSNLQGGKLGGESSGIKRKRIANEEMRAKKFS